MNVIEIQDITPNTKLVSFKDTAMLLNILYPETVEDLLEVFTDFTDFDIIAELVDTLDLNITAVRFKFKLSDSSAIMSKSLKSVKDSRISFTASG